MQLRNPGADIFVPDGAAPEAALARVTHLGIGAHQDDLEFMAFHGILECYHSPERWFGGVTCTNGSGSARTGPYAGYSDEQMVVERYSEQKAAAVVGRYAAMIQLGYRSAQVKHAPATDLLSDLRAIMEAARPGIVYTHNLADKHDTHIGVAVAAIEAMRDLPGDMRPSRVWGCEVWRGLDWLLDEEKVVMDVSGHENLASALNGIFDSQISGGKRYDVATLGRRRANATFFESHATDSSTMLAFGMDLTPLVADPTLDLADYVCSFIERFQADVREKLRRRVGERGS